MAEKTRVYTPNKAYDVQVKIKDLDYTNDTIEMSIISTLNSAYQIIELVFLLDPNDIIIEDIFGGEPIKLAITLLREQDYPGPRIDVELMYLSSDFELTQKDEMSRTTMKDRTQLTVTTIVRQAYSTMSSLVNDVFIGQKLSQIIASLASSAGTSILYDTYGQNTEVIDQVSVPPTTLYKIIKENNRQSDDIFDGYLDQRFGLFDGVAGVFCQYDNKVYIKNLTPKLQRNQAFTVYQLASGVTKSIMEKIYDESLGGRVFYTYDNIETGYAGNAKFGDLASSIKHIVKPKDTLFQIISQDLDTLGEKYSLMYSKKNKNLYIDPAVRRTRYYNEDTGYEKEETIFNARFGRSMANLSSLSLNLERNLPLLNLIDVGECVKFKPFTIEYADFEGKYILWSSIINFQKEGPGWETTANINLYRTNKKN